MNEYPKSIATLLSLRDIPKIFNQLPSEVQKKIQTNGPDYPKLRKELLGLDWETSASQLPNVDAAPTLDEPPTGAPSEDTLPGVPPVASDPTATPAPTPTPTTAPTPASTPAGKVP